MDHPHHDDSHLPQAVENTEENRERLITHILDKKQPHEIREIAWSALEEIFQSDDTEFQEDWNLHMEN